MKVDYLTTFDQGIYLPYPTNNGFCRGDGCILLGQVENGIASLVLWDLGSGFDSMVVEVPVVEDVERTGFLLYDVAKDADLVVYRANQSMWLVDLENPGEPQQVFAAPLGSRIEGLHSLSPDGKYLYVVLRPDDDHWELERISIGGGQSETVLRTSWCIGHPQVSPFDPNWVGFCHDNRIDIPDRIWAWNADSSPDGICLSDQRCDPPETWKYYCHEKWRNDSHAVVAIAYDSSPGGGAGVYEFRVDQEPRLIQECPQLWHCGGVSPDGMWAVADTKLPASPSQTEIKLIATDSMEQRTVARAFSKLDSQLTHPHPRFTPDGKSVLFQEADDGDILRCRIGCIDVQANG